jgi:hypothetical protein
MLRDATDPGTLVSRVLFEDITAFSENAAVLSGALPGKALQNITLRNVNLTITKLGNYSAGGPGDSTSSGPSIEYDPHPPGVPSRRSLVGWMPGLYAEAVKGLTLDNVNIAFDSARAQPYWGTVCVNSSAAGSPVSIVGGSCVAP